MPTILLVDASLASLRKITDSTTFLDLYKLFIRKFLEKICERNRYEVVALATFSTNLVYLTPFSRDPLLILNKLNDIALGTKSCFITALNDLSYDLTSEWGMNEEFLIILITNGNVGNGPGSLKNYLETNHFINFPYPCHLIITILNDAQVTNRVIPYWDKFKKSIKTGHMDLIINQTESDSTKSNFLDTVTDEMIQKLLNKYANDDYLLRCGEISEPINIWPSIPSTAMQLFNCPCDKSHLQGIRTRQLVLEIQGFVESSQIINLPYLSKHLITTSILPSTNNAQKIPSFVVLIHGSLKIENMAAFVKLAYVRPPSSKSNQFSDKDVDGKCEIFGFIYSSITSCENKKKSNLFLSILPPGYDTVPVIGDIRNLAFLTAPSTNNLSVTSTKSVSEHAIAENNLQQALMTVLSNKKRRPLSSSSETMANESNNINNQQKPSILIPNKTNAHRMSQSSLNISKTNNTSNYINSYSPVGLATARELHYGTNNAGPLYSFRQQYTFTHNLQNNNNSDEESDQTAVAIDENNPDILRLIRLTRKMIGGYESALLNSAGIPIPNMSVEALQKALNSKIETYYRELSRFRARVITSHPEYNTQSHTFVFQPSLGLVPKEQSVGDVKFQGILAKAIEILRSEIPADRIIVHPSLIKAGKWNIFAELQYSFFALRDFQNHPFDCYLKPSYLL